MFFDLSFDTVANVIETWEAVKRVPNYEEVVAIELSQRYETNLIIKLPTDDLPFFF